MLKLAREHYTSNGSSSKQGVPIPSSPCSSKSSMDLLIYRQKITLYQLQQEHVPNTHWNFSRSQSPMTIVNSTFSPELFVVGTLYQPMWLRLPVWYPSNGSYKVCQSKLSSLAMQVHSCDTLKLCCWGLCVPWYPQGRQFGWELKSGKCIGQTLFSGFLSTMLLTFLSFSLFLMQQTPAL